MSLPKTQIHTPTFPKSLPNSREHVLIRPSDQSILCLRGCRKLWMRLTAI